MDNARTTPIGAASEDIGSVVHERPRLSRRHSEALWALLFISPWLVGFLLFTAGPMVFSFGISFWETSFLNKSEYVGLANYREMLDDPLFSKALRVTFTYTMLTVPFATVIALGIALLLNNKLLLNTTFRTIYYLPALVSRVAVALVWGWVLNPSDGLVNRVLRSVGLPGPRWFASENWAVPGLAPIALWGTGTNMLLYLAGLQGIPTDLKEAARIDGAGAVRSFLNVTLPLLTPTIFFNVILNVISSFQAFTQAYVLTKGGPNNATLTMVMYLYREAFLNFQFGYASALAWTLFAIVFVFTLILIRSQSLWVHYEGGLRS